uniref:Glycoside hydrolase family 12 n=1 Tax=Ignisphaera aggregans TaxID=334771 RepID=A0A7C4NNX2_9CREN
MGALENLVLVPCDRDVEVKASKHRRSNITSIGKASIDPNLWAIQEGFIGEVTMMCINGEVVVDNNMFSPLALINTYAYHEVIYGPKPWGMPPDHPQSREPLKLPLPVEDLISGKRVTLYTNFMVERLDQATNIAYDIWLTQAPRFHGGPKVGDVELMVWIYRGSSSEWLPSPAGKKVGEVNIPTYVEGNVSNIGWDVWYHPSVPWGGWSYLAFVSTKPSTDVAIELTEFLKHVEVLLGHEKTNKLHINNIEIGTEVFVYKPGSAGIQWRLKKFYIVVAKPSKDIEELLINVATI